MRRREESRNGKESGWERDKVEGGREERNGDHGRIKEWRGQREGVEFTLPLQPGVVYFILNYYVDKYNIYYVYCPAPFSGRQFLHRSAVNFVIMGAVQMQLLFLFFSIVRLGV